MVRAIFRHQPYLQQIFNNDHDANEIFRFCLKHTSKMLGRRCQMLYQKFCQSVPSLGKENQTAKQGVAAWDVENYLPSLQDGEDQNTISADRVRLASQFNLIEEKRDPHIIRNLMNLTFPHRRQLLIQGMSTIRKVINLYPILQYERQVYLNPCDFTTELLTFRKFFCMGVMSIGRS